MALTAVILLIFVLVSLVSDVVLPISVRFIRFSLDIRLTTMDLLGPVVALIAAVGVYTSISTRSVLSDRTRVLYLIVPFASTYSLGMLLDSVAFGIGWMVILFFGGILIYSVFYAESFLCDRSDPRSPLAAVLVTALAYAAAAQVFIGIQAASTRLVLLLPVLFGSTALISLRIFYLESSRPEIVWQSVVMALLVSEIGAALYYLPLAPISFGIALFGFYYGAMNVVMVRRSGYSLKVAVRKTGWFIATILPVFIYFEFIR